VHFDMTGALFPASAAITPKVIATAFRQLVSPRRRNGSGRISVGGLDHAVRFTAADPTVRTQVDETHRAKYGRYSNLVRPMISDSVAETTLQLQPTIS